MNVEYSVLIRTFNSANVLGQTLAALACQTHPPAEYIVVDSGSVDATLTLMPDGAKVHRFEGERFNYAEALNQGLEHVSNDIVLILSSHTIITDRHALEHIVTVLTADDDIGAAYITDHNSSSFGYAIIDAAGFTGFNGLWNTCSIVKMTLLRQRGFRPEVFTAEDQEWSRWLLMDAGKTVARFSGAGVVINNPRKHSARKRENEYVAIAYFANPTLLKWRNLYHVACRIVRPGWFPAVRERFAALRLFCRLVACHIRMPRANSRYF